MLSKVNSGYILGMEIFEVGVEVDVSGGLPAFSVVGLPDTSIRESRARIHSAIRNSGFLFPDGRITVNLSPACIKKEGAGFDLPIALGILSAAGLFRASELEGLFFCGELSLNGTLNPFRGALPLAISLKNKYRSLILPKRNAVEAANAGNITAFGAASLRAVAEHIKGINPLKSTRACGTTKNKKAFHQDMDFKDVKGQEHVKRALEVAASGGHNALLLGPPGAGKSMLAKRFPAILPDLTPKESLEVTKIYSIAGKLKSNDLIKTRPVRSPHHTISYAAMAGGGSHPSPGEISLAHNGVLFLDEFPEFRRDVLETLRQPLESGEITISRAERTVTFPSSFTLIAAMNPCPCGYFTDTHRECRCSPQKIQRYLSKISGPLLDRIDIHIEVPRLDYEKLSEKRTGEPSRLIRERVVRVRELQKNRFGRGSQCPPCNSHMSSRQTDELCILSGEAEELLKTAILELGISARAYGKILKISRTIADMEGVEVIASHHISEAIGYRCLDRNLWM